MSSTTLKKKISKTIDSSLVISSFLLFSFLFGCSPAKGYSGPNKKPNQLAVVRAHGVTLHQVNGIEIGATSTGVLVLPGQNELHLTVNQSNYNDRGSNTKVYQLIMTAEAGKQYTVTGKRGDGRLCAWEIDSQTGQPNYSISAGCISPQ